MKILALDISASPGVAVIEIKRNRPKLLYVDSVKTDTKFSDSQRYSYIEAFAIKAIHEYGPFDAVVREKYTGTSRSKRAKQLVYGAWAAIDMALGKYGYSIDEKDEIVASAIKKAVSGKGTADKEEVADGVRRILGEDIEFKSDDASDAVAVALTYALLNGLIKEESENGR
ncbi:crossover junction endodeoxyribonuclease RuvC [Lederbergia citri]|uniref:Crossover junction endodeoxyribonuclease RuvC n=1 Tax=Lederbergia citri TaxID=2833580 RepID=A0A942YFS6_9BACI|nr:crossover junction endodeoxyribonuclease RuvC [Lederbergia citri]MBS4195363.1 crossover junction endodeoxyribonuclease RuvC [Lederbergia citri]